MTIGVITEQGDLGLGFSVLNESDQSKVKGTDKKESEKDSQKK